MINLQSKVQLVWIQSFPSFRLIALPRLKNPVNPTIYPELEGETDELKGISIKYLKKNDDNLSILWVWNSISM